MAARARAADTHEGEITVNAELIAVGTEILLGDIVNTDAQLISQGLSELGINVFYQTVVGDNPARLRHVIETARDRADIIITTGGLGPTLDDLTKETLATVFGKKMALHQPSLDRLTEFFNKIGREMTKNNEKQAWLPEGCTVFTNLWGTAPGCAFEAYGKHVLMLPGPPRECNPMWKECAMPYLYKLAGGCIVSHNIRVFGLGESSMEHILHDMMEKSKNPTIAPYAKTSECFARVTAKADTTEECEKLLEPVVREIVELLGDDVALVSIMAANNETGVVQPIRDLATAAHTVGALFHTDAIQGYLHIPLDAAELGVDAMSVAAHKIGGPVASGALYLKNRTPLRPRIFGGGQEAGRRAGTQDLRTQLAFAAAARTLAPHVAQERAKLQALSDKLYATLTAHPRIHATMGDYAQADRLPGMVSIYIDGMDSEELIIKLDAAGFEVSAGSACSSGSMDPSHVLSAMGIGREQALGALRISFDDRVNPDDLDDLAQTLLSIVGAA